MSDNPNNPTKEFTLEELSKYDGIGGKPSYVAINGIVYDVSNVPVWNSGMHFGLGAGRDLSQDYMSCHSGINDILNKLKRVGILK